MTRASTSLTLLCAALCLGGCHLFSSKPDAPVAAPQFDQLSVEDIARLIPAKARDREGWARDVAFALTEHEIGTAPASVCSVLAVIEQESGYRENPAVAGLAGIVQKRLDAYAARLGPVGKPLLDKLLEGRAPGSKRSFSARLKAVRTERDVDRVFRDLLRYYEEKYPKTYAVVDLLGGLFSEAGIEDLNPITTAGSMQVSVRFARELGRKRGLGDEEVREALYTRRGGVYYGTARLLLFEAGYDAPVYRFADYNAGFYASRNAALQEQLTRLTGHKLAPDGDLLAYDKAGEPLDKETNTLRALYAFRSRYAPELSERQVRKDALLEKTLDFESTKTWRAVKSAYRRATGEAPRYARLPDVALKSPKLKRKLSTAWFAKNVDRRYQACMQRWRTL